jgi:metallo-beta-lactamase family protein
MLSIQFLGAAGQVTGSKYFVRTATHRGTLVDCGLFQGGRELSQMNWDPLPIHLPDVANIVLTHAHLDHTGYLPRLVSQGFHGPIYCTPSTKEVTEFILRDSAHLQEEDSKNANRHHYSRHKPALPLYTTEDAEAALMLLTTVERHKKKVLPDDLSFEYFNAGHILGANFILMEKRFDEVNGVTPDPIKILFSGDIGRDHPVYLNPKEDPPAADYVICESTYGDRLHTSIDPIKEFGDIVKEIIKSKTVLLVPAFAVDRAQELIYALNAMIRDGEIPAIPTYVDSPMATSVTGLYEKYSDEHTMSKEELSEPDKNPLSFSSLHFVQSPEDSKRLNALKGPAIIISASGMGTGGRIVHHLRNRLPDSNTTVLFTGYQAEGTLGRHLTERAKQVSIFGENVNVVARILMLGSFSAHADQGEILRWLGKMPKAPKKIFLTHGENEARDVLKKEIDTKLGWEVHLPHLNEIVDLAQS